MIAFLHNSILLSLLVFTSQMKFQQQQQPQQPHYPYMYYTSVELIYPMPPCRLFLAMRLKPPLSNSSHSIIIWFQSSWLFFFFLCFFAVCGGVCVPDPSNPSSPSHVRPLVPNRRLALDLIPGPGPLVCWCRDPSALTLFFHPSVAMGERPQILESQIDERTERMLFFYSLWER